MGRLRSSRYDVRFCARAGKPARTFFTIPTLAQSLFSAVFSTEEKGRPQPSGFNPQSEQVQVARAMVRDLTSRARQDGIVPVIYIVNNFGFSDYLFEALKPALEADRIP
jgi:hypothetical protein